MAKYKLECYGWEIEAMALSLTEEQVEDIQILMEDNGYDEISEARFELEDIGIDLYESDIFHLSKPMYNEKLWFKVVNEAEEEVIKFSIEDIVHIEEVIDDFEPNDVFIAIPEAGKIERILFCIDEWKGALFYMAFETDDVPTLQDFAYSGNCIETPDDEWDFVEELYFKGKRLNVTDYFDKSGKGSVMGLWALDDI